MALHRLSRIEVGVPAGTLASARVFYRDFGLSEVSEGRFATSDGGEQLVLVPAPRRSLRALEVGVDDADDLGRAAASLEKLGIAAQRHGGSLRTRDPATGIEATLTIQAPLVQQPAPLLGTNRPGCAVRVDARSAAAVPGATPRPRKLSHVVTTSPDAAASRRFFVEGLGFRVSDEIAGLGAAFLRCSTDHHNVLVQPGPVAFLHHTAWEMDDVDAVGRAAAVLLEADPGRHVWGLGRHAIGSNYFWYLRDPAGNFVEYTSDLDVVVDEEVWRIASSAAVEGLAAWGPPVPIEFLAPADIAALVAEGA